MVIPPPSARSGSSDIRVLVVDDQELFRRGLTMLLGAEPGVEVVGEAGDGVEGTLLAERTAIPGVEVRADVQVSLNGRPLRPLIDPRVNLAAESEGLRPKPWILPLE